MAYTPSMASWTVSSISRTTGNHHSQGSLAWQLDQGTLEQAPADYVGFVYVIHNPTTSRYYIGQKLFWSVKKLPPLVGQTRRRHKRVETDWKNYWGSSTLLHADLELQGKQNFERVIVDLATTKGELNYLEAKLQFEHDVLLDPLSYNGIINCKIHRSHLPKSE